VEAASVLVIAECTVYMQVFMFAYEFANHTLELNRQNLGKVKHGRRRHRSDWMHLVVEWLSVGIRISVITAEESTMGRLVKCSQARPSICCLPIVDP
jgi:hypothetical protein